MLHLIGLGLDDDEITLKGLEALKQADKVFAEFYTNTKTVNISRLEEKVDQDIEELSREEVEQKNKIIESAKEQDTVFLVSGDPLTATTHYDIKHRAEEQDIETEVVHAPSIFTSVAETGLNVYKFGRTVTLPKNSAPSSIIDYIEKNNSVGLHTLVLLDIDYPADEAASKLIEMKPGLQEKDVVVVERANKSSQNITLDSLENISDQNLGNPPHCIVILGETSHMEEDFIEVF